MGAKKSKMSSLNIFAVLRLSQFKLAGIFLCITLFLVTPSKSTPDACGGILKEENGTIMSPTFTGMYRLYPNPNIRCIWDIQARPTRRQSMITLDFPQSEIEGSGWCRFSSIFVSSILANGETRNLGSFCRSTLPSHISSETNHMKIEFNWPKSNYVDEFQYTRFIANYSIQAPSCDSSLYFRCNETFDCISLSYVCDGIIDCRDMSDEQNCTGNIKGNNETENTEPHPVFDFNSYAKVLTDPINQTDLEFLIDYKEEEKDILAMHSDFNPEKIMRALFVRAASTATPPNQFHWEIRQLLSPENGADQTYFEELLEKYKIRSKAEDPYTATLFRLRMMFPHYCNLGQKPFFSSPKINVAGSFEAPAMLQYAEFAGLIPREDSALDSGYESLGPRKKMLIALHLYLLSRNREETVPLRIRCLTLKERMEKSMLSDERRIRLLQNNNVLSASKKVDGTFICTAADDLMTDNCIPSIFRNGCDSFL